jgi:amino acid adenylation domain-containing protein
MLKKAENLFPKEMVEGSIAARFEQQVDLFKEVVAVRSKGKSLTYGKLNQAANQVARSILGSHTVESAAVAMLFDHDIPAVVAILGILKAGKTYVPLDPAFPIPRLKYMVEDSRAGLVLTNSKTLSLAQDLFQDQEKIINIDDLEESVSGENLGLNIPATTLAFILYSSGSTGKPKGIIQDHRNVLHHIWDHTTLYEFSNRENQALVLSFSFAASVSEIFCPLLNGGTLCLYDIKQGGLIELADWMAAEEITILKIPISLFRIFLSTLSGGGHFPKLRLVILGGDTLYRRDITNFRQHFSPNCVLVNRLTSTETNSVTQFIIEPGMALKDRVIPVGYPAQDKEITLLDEEGNQVDFGEIGEIVIKSRYITPGYWNQPELSGDRFEISDGDSDTLIFHTGDLGRMRPDGCLEHIGRTDFMVKIRGYRVEMAEITAALLEMETIEDAVVIAPPDSTGEKHLVAYVVPVDPAATQVRNIRDKLAEDLPDYMIPTEFVILEQLPKTPTGKVDYQNLPEIDSVPAEKGDLKSSPRTTIEKDLLAIWGGILERDNIGLEDDFFDLGGNSLDALRTVAEIEEKLGVPLTLSAFNRARTIENLAEVIQGHDSTEFSYLVAVEPGGSKPPFFCVPPSATTVMAFGKLAQHMGKERPFYGLDYAGMDAKHPPHLSIPEMAETYLEEIKRVQPEGPYFLGGMCFGGLVAYEMAQQLLAQGQKVAFLGILDSTHAPNLSKPRGYYVFLVTRFINQKLLRGRFTVGASSMRIPGDDVYRNQVQHVFASHNYARMKYRTTTYPGKITLFNTTGRKGQFARQQWDPIAQGGLEVVKIPGVHLGHMFGMGENGDTFIREPHVQVLAEKLKKCLDESTVAEN